jgi:hypothetical protein
MLHGHQRGSFFSARNAWKHDDVALVHFRIAAVRFDEIGAMELAQLPSESRRWLIGARGFRADKGGGDQQRHGHDQAVHAGNSHEIHGACGVLPCASKPYGVLLIIRRSKTYHELMTENPQ